MKRVWELVNDQTAKEVVDGEEYCGNDHVGGILCLIAALWPMFYILWPLLRKDTFMWAVWYVRHSTGLSTKRRENYGVLTDSQDRGDIGQV